MTSCGFKVAARNPKEIAEGLFQAGCEHAGMLSGVFMRYEWWRIRVFAPAFVVFLGALAMSGGRTARAAVRYVAPSHAQAQDAGAGSQDKPYRTLAFAMSQIQPGDTLRIAAGVYREALIFPRRAWATTRPTVIEGDANSPAVLLGTDVITGWENAGSGRFVKRNWLVEPQQVLVKGVMLKQIGGTIFSGYPVKPGHELAALHRSQGGIWPTRQDGNTQNMPAGSFYYDATSKNLFVRAPDGQPPGSVDVAVRSYLIQGNDLSGVTIRDLQIRYSNTTTTSRQGAVTVVGDHNTLTGLVVDDVDGVGIELSGNSNILRDSTVARAGYLGIKARGQGVLIEKNVVSYNNTRGFNKWWEAGGMKFVGAGGLRDSRVTHNLVHHNYGDGIWFDWGNQDNWIESNVSAYNSGMGIHYEASSKGIIVDNRVFANGQRGIYLPHSHDSWVAHNLVMANGLDGITAIDEGRRDSKAQLELRPHGNYVVANVLAWNLGLAIILPGNHYENRSDGNLFIDDGVPMFSMGWPSLQSPKVGLVGWRKRYGQDVTSLNAATPMTASIKSAIAAGDLNVNRFSLEAWVGAYTVTPDSEILGAVPAGLQITKRAGPR